MNRRSLVIAAGFALFAGPAFASTLADGALDAETSPEPLEAKKGGRGRRVGWSRGRGKAFGRKRKFGM